MKIGKKVVNFPGGTEQVHLNEIGLRPKPAWWDLEAHYRDWVQRERLQQYFDNKERK